MLKDGLGLSGVLPVRLERGNQGADAPDAPRVTLHDSSLALVEDWVVQPDALARPAYGVAHQLALAYHGLLRFTANWGSCLVDPNRALLVTPGWSSFQPVSHSGRGFAVVLIRPSAELLQQILGAGGSERLSSLADRCLPASMRLRLLTQQLRRGRAGTDDQLQMDECVIHAVREAIGIEPPSLTQTSKAVERAKELLHSRTGERLQLDEIASEVGLTPVYLTQEFTRCEGIPLYRYQLQLRLTRALLELPGCADITGLALDLGFSSHSHFTSAFRKAFGVTPSHYRTSDRTASPRSEKAARAVDRRHAA